MDKLIEDFKVSAWNSTWGRVGMAIGIPAAIIGHYVGAMEGIVVALVVGVPACFVALVLDCRRPTER